MRIILITCLISALGILSSVMAVRAQDDDGIVKVDSSIVLMNATIRDTNGKPVTGLKQNEFKIFEDGVQQEISFFGTDDLPFAAVILLDTSGSMTERISIARSAAINFLDGLREGDVAAIYRFDSRIGVVQDFSESRDVSAKIFDLKAGGMTVLNDALLKAAGALAERQEQRKAIVVISDGADNFSGASADKALKAALAANITIYTVDMSTMSGNGAARRQNQGVLRNFAERSGGTFISTESGIAMRQALRNIVDELRIQYTLAFEPVKLKRDGKWHELELRVSRPDLTIRTRKGYNAPKGVQ